MRKKPMLCFLGDSHLASVRHAKAAGLFQPYKVRIAKVGGATAMGLRNLGSKTRALDAYRTKLKKLENLSRTVIVVMQLGEVDCGAAIWRRAEHNGETIDDQLDIAVGSYFAFVDEIIAGGHPEVIVTSAILPTLRDGQREGKVAPGRASVTATLAERTALTARYNARLKEEAEKRGLRFVDFTPTLSDPETGLVRDDFRHPKTTNHHLDPKRGAQMWASAILAAIEARPDDQSE